MFLLVIPEPPFGTSPLMLSLELARFHQELLKHVRRARCKLILFVDNQAAVRRLRRAWEKGQWHGLLAPFWRRAAEGLSDHVTVRWVPSHSNRSGVRLPR